MAASQQIETVSTGADKAKLALVALLLVGGIAGFYLLAKQGVLVQWAVLIVAIVAAAGVFAVSESGRRFTGFAKDAWKEVKKVVWPTRKETLITTGLVLALSALAAVFFLLTDKLIQFAVGLLFGIGA